MSNKATSSGLKTVSTVIATYPCSITHLNVTGASGTWVIYDSASTTTTGKTVIGKVTTGASETNKDVDYNTPIWCNEGIYITQTGGTDFTCAYMPA